MMGLFLDRRAARWGLLLGILALFGLAGELALSGSVPLKMLPYDNKSELQAVLDLPEGSTLEATARLAAECEAHLAGVAEVRDVTSHVGLASAIDFNGLVRHYNLRREPHLCDLRINLVGKKERRQQSHAIGLRLRRGLEEIAARHGAELKIVEVPPGPPVLSTIVAEVTGPPARSYAELIDAARDVRRRLRMRSGVVDVDDMSEAERTRLDFRLDKEKASLHGVGTDEVVRTLRLALSGDQAATVHEPDERTPLRLRLVLSRAGRSGAEELSRLRVKGAAGVLVPLAEIGAFAPVPEEQPVYHKDLERVVFVLAEVAGTPPAEAVLALQEDLEENPLPGGIRAGWAGEGEWKVTLDVFRDLGLAFAGALVGIYALLVFQTRSFTMPLVIMLAIPLGAVGILPGFFALNRLAGGVVDGWADPVWFTATGMIGMIALAGIVVRNSIILIDFISRRTAEGAPLREAVVESGRARLRPILLTGGAALLGAWPITLDPIFSGLAWSLIFGVVASTAFTLVAIPVVVYAFGRKR